MSRATVAHNALSAAPDVYAGPCRRRGWKVETLWRAFPLASNPAARGSSAVTLSYREEETLREPFRALCGPVKGAMAASRGSSDFLEVVGEEDASCEYLDLAGSGKEQR